jgi:hypothetical protein
MFTKTDERTLSLTAVMPLMDEMAEAARDGRDVPPTKESLLEYQRLDFLLIKEKFSEAGFEVVDSNDLLTKI